MVRPGKTAQEFIQGSFSPINAVLCSTKVHIAVSKNNLSFVDLLQPFTTFDWEGQFREPNGTVCIVKNWKLVVRDVTWKPLQPTEARRQLNNAVLHNYNDKTVAMEIGSWKINLSQSTPWFDAWRESYFEVQFPSDHEYTKHFLSCILVATTMEDNIVETFNDLNQQFTQYQTVTAPKLPKWFNSNVLKTYVLIHDASSVAQEKADSTFETMKQHLEASNCFMLTINSKNSIDPPIAGDLWAPFLRTYSSSNSEVTSPTTNLPSTPLEHQVGQTPVITGEEDINFGITTTQPETPHPLTVDNDVYDNANSLQTHSFSGSSESVSIVGKALDYSNEVHGAALNSTDIESLKKFMQDYASKALLPYIERQIATLSELVANRKGVSRSLLSATKRWFGTGKGGNTTGNNSVIYSTDCPELQLRRLGDLWFMCGQWQRAFDTYHTAKREFYADGAWLCYAGALEMAALSAFMAGDANRKTHGYFEESIVTYLNTCRMVQYAVRATLLSAICLGSSGLHGEAAKQLIRMTSEDSDLRSAMLLEQAALCFLLGPAGSRAMGRKYAFHMVLAGHRFSKAGQKKHAYRCYKQAYEVYAGSGWRLSTDHVQFALGRLAGALRQSRDAATWLAAPLAPHSPQPPRQHHAFLRDYMLAHQQWVSSMGVQRSLVALPLPLLSHARTAVLVAGPAPLSAPGRAPATSVTLQDAHSSRPGEHKYWDKLEQMCLHAARGAVPMIFRPTVNVFTAALDASPSVPQGEPIQISISLRNPLKVAIVLKDLELLWRFQPNTEGVEKTEDWLGNEASVATGSPMEHNVIYGQKIKSVVLESECEDTLTFSLTPLQVGLLKIHSVAYKLVSGAEELSEVANSITISGKIDLEEDNPFKCLSITVIPCAPCLQMTFSETNPDVICGEMRSVDVEFRNVGPVGMTGLHLAVSHPDCMHLVSHPPTEPHEHFKLLNEDKFSEPPTQLEERTARSVSWRAACGRHVRALPPAAAALPPAAAARAVLLLRPRTGARALYLLAYYEPQDTAGKGYRLLRHVFRFNVHEVVEVSATPRRCISVAAGGAAAAEKMSLAVEVKNVSDDQHAPAALQVLEASLLGKQWRFTDYVSATRNKNDCLSSREKCHLVLEAARLPQPRDKIQSSSLKIAKGVPDSEPDIDTPPYSKFVLEYKTSFIEDEDSFLRDGKTKPNGLIESMLVVRWKVQDKTSGRSVIGQHCLWLECFTRAVTAERTRTALDLTALDDDTKSDEVCDKSKTIKENIVLVNMVHSSEINHNFKQSKLCLIPITINIVNCYAVPVTAFIDMSKKSSLGWSGALSPGPLGLRVHLAAMQSHAVHVRALVAAPGSYLPTAAVSVAASLAGATAAAAHQLDDSSLLVVRQAA